MQIIVNLWPENCNRIIYVPGITGAMNQSCDMCGVICVV